MLSILTPTHNAHFLGALYTSLRAQTHKDWEWVVCPNGPKSAEITAYLASLEDPRIIVKSVPGWVSQNIGALKYFAFMQARGDVLIEMDHDDWLREDCLAKIAAAAEGHPNRFIYSRSLGLWGDGRHENYDPAFGWTHEEVVYEGRSYQNPVNFPITARSLAEIYFCPNHVRAWTREAYTKLNGHNPTLPVADDHDLMCRTYLAGIEFHEIPEVLYYQRRHPESTCIARQKEVAHHAEQVKNKYLHPLIFEWCKREKLEMIDLGGAHNCPRHLGFKALDMDEGAKVEYPTSVLWDAFLTMIPNNSVGCFRANDFLEHIPVADVTEVMNRLYDKLAPGGWLISATPAVAAPDGSVGLGAFQDPTHTSYWSTHNFWYFTDRNYSKYVSAIRCRFQAVNLACGYPGQWHKDNKCPYVVADLMAVKGSERVPGLMKI